MITIQPNVCNYHGKVILQSVFFFFYFEGIGF